MRWPKLAGSPVLDSLAYVIERSRDVQTRVSRIAEVAGWMAYEELPMPDYALPLGAGENDPDWIMDFILTASCIDTAFTDFSSQVKFQVDYAGRHWSDSDALFASMKRALDEGIPILNGEFLAAVTRTEMVKRFRDVSDYDGHTVKIYKLPQLAVWFLYLSLNKTGQFPIGDLERMTAFADYIVPAALHLLGITSYSQDLEHAVRSHQLIARDSRWEIEIRAHCIYASALLAEDINKLRAPDMQIIVPQVDFRLWSHYHTTWWPHHLTRTIMY